MKEKLEQIKAEALEKIKTAASLEELNDVRVNQLGKKGALTGILKSMKDVDESNPRYHPHSRKNGLLIARNVRLRLCLLKVLN